MIRRILRRLRRKKGPPWGDGSPAHQFFCPPDGAFKYVNQVTLEDVADKIDDAGAGKHGKLAGQCGGYNSCAECMQMQTATQISLYLVTRLNQIEKRWIEARARQREWGIDT